MQFQRQAQPIRPLAQLPPGHDPSNDPTPQKRFGVAGSLHFWQSGTSPIGPIMKVYQRGEKSTLEDAVWHVWSEILRVYIPSVVTPGDPFWTIQRESYRYKGTNKSVSATRPDITATLWTPNGVQQPGRVPSYSSRDFLWVECKAAKYDTVDDWYDFIEQVVRRLQDSVPRMTVFVMLATGMKCMYFIWQPHKPAGTVTYDSVDDMHWPALRILNKKALDRRLKALHSSSWVDQSTGNIDLNGCMNLDCWSWTGSSGSNPNLLDNHVNLTLIEAFLTTVIQTAVLMAHNPGHWC